MDLDFAQKFPGVVSLLLKDHEAMRNLLKKIESPRSTPENVAELRPPKA